MSDYTPGPWEINTANGRIPVVRRIKMPHQEADTFQSTVQAKTGPMVCRLDFGYGRKTNEADARLIAAAPDLLDALRGILEIGKRDMTNPKYDTYFEAAKNAIYRATGE